MNHSMDKEVQDYTYYTAFIEIKQDRILIQTINPDDKTTTGSNDNNLFRFKKSSSSCHVSEIRGIIFGGISSRFWLLRKHINSLTDIKKLRNFPFFAWNCITLQLKDREVDLVIKKENEMKMFLTYLIYKI
jgi:hypothetical protein